MKILNIIMVLSMVVAVGCGAARTGTEDGLLQAEPTLLIINQSIDMLRIYDHMGRIVTVSPGRTECVRFRNVQSVRRLSFTYVGSFERWYTPEAPFDGYEGWVWRINTSQPALSTIDIMPTSRCEIGSHRSAYFNRDEYAAQSYYVYQDGYNFYVSLEMYDYWPRSQVVYVAAPTRNVIVNNSRYTTRAPAQSRSQAIQPRSRSAQPVRTPARNIVRTPVRRTPQRRAQPARSKSRTPVRRRGG